MLVKDSTPLLTSDRRSLWDSSLTLSLVPGLKSWNERWARAIMPLSL